MPARKYPKCEFCPHNRDMHSRTRVIGCWLCDCQAVSGIPELSYQLGARALAQLDTMATLGLRGITAAEELITRLPTEHIVDYSIFSSVRAGYHSVTDLLYSLNRLREDGHLSAAHFRPTLGIDPTHFPEPRRRHN